MAKFAIAKLEDIDVIDDGRCPFRPVRHHLGITTFGINAMTARADGDRLINEHDEDEPQSSEELYVVISGHATFELNGSSHEAPPGTFVHVLPGVKRTAVAREAGTTVLAIGAGPEGEPFKPSGWELLAETFPLYESGDYEQAAERAKAVIATNPQYWAVYYNAACFEARAGRTDDAILHLRQAAELSPSAVEFARGDDDLAALREDVRFREFIGEPAG